jgi:hypothetical protein
MAAALFPEVTMLDRVAASEVGSTIKRLYGHYDYFGYVIPVTWLLVGWFAAERYLFDSSPVPNPLKLTNDWFSSREAASIGTAGGVVVGVLGLVLLFNLSYALGHIINSLSALLLDRVVVKKYLHYPTVLYERKCEQDATHDEHTLFRIAVVGGTSYFVSCLNLAVWLPLEIVLGVWLASRNGANWSSHHAVLICLAILVIVFLHLGVPGAQRARLLDPDEKSRGWYGEAASIHATAVLLIAFLVAYWFVWSRSAWVLAALPGLNLALILVERKRRDASGEYSTVATKRFFLYMRSTLVAPLYFIAVAVGYGRSPSEDVLRRARDSVLGKSFGSDFFWLCYIRLINRAPLSYPTAYHFLSLYGMNRNLAAATGTLLAYIAVHFAVHRPLAVGDGAILIVASVLWGLSLVFFARYLYMYAGYFSKYIVRVAAWITDESADESQRARSAINSEP